MKVSYNGGLVEIEQAPCSPSGWLQGGGIFETLRTIDGQVFAFSRHLRRAEKSAVFAHVTLPKRELIVAAINDLLLAQPCTNGLLRISFDRSGMWAAVHLPYEPIVKGAKLRTHPDALISKGETIKSYPYEYRLAIIDEAKLLGFDEAIVHSTEGNICEAAVSNLILKIDGRWVTPPTSDGLLAGIMRELVIDYCRVSIDSVPLSRIDDISAAVLLSSLRIAQPVASIDGRDLEPSQGFVDEIQAMAALHSVD